MLGFLIQHGQPVIVEIHRHPGIGKADQDVGGEINGVQLYMGERMEQRDPPRLALRLAAPRHLAREQQFRFCRAFGPVARRGPADIGDNTRPPVGHDSARRTGFGRGIGRAENTYNPVGQGLGHDCFT